MKTAVFIQDRQTSKWFDTYLEAINYCLRMCWLIEIKEESYVLAKDVNLKFLLEKP